MKILDSELFQVLFLHGLFFLQKLNISFIIVYISLYFFCIPFSLLICLPLVCQYNSTFLMYNSFILYFNIYIFQNILRYFCLLFHTIFIISLYINIKNLFYRSNSISLLAYIQDIACFVFHLLTNLFCLLLPVINLGQPRSDLLIEFQCLALKFLALLTVGARNFCDKRENVPSSLSAAEKSRWYSP